MPTRNSHSNPSTRALWTSLVADPVQLAAAHAIVHAAANDGDDIAAALREAVEWVAPVWVWTGDAQDGNADDRQLAKAPASH